MRKAIFLISLLAVVTISCNTSGKKEAVEEVASVEIEEDVFIKADTVKIHSMQFIPKNVLATKGQKLVWVNEGIVGHNVTEEPDRSRTSGDFEPGESWEMTIDESFDYLCTLHPTMTGSVKVIE